MQEAVIFYNKEFDDYWHNEMLVKDLALPQHITRYN